MQVIIKSDNDFISSVRNGDSISINGVCLTAYNVDKDNKCFSIDISNETLDLTTLTQMSTGYNVNLESALSLNDKLGGHIVSGHVDCMAQVSEIQEDARSYRLSFVLNNEFYAKYTFECGDIISLDLLEFPYFETFSNSGELEVQFVSEIGSTSFEVEAESPIINIEGKI